jgi:hypothetical protein
MRPLHLLVGLVLLATSSEARGQTRRALLVGINDYVSSGGAGPTPEGAPVAVALGGKLTSAPVSRGRGWTNLNGSLNDVAEMKALLVGRFGFEESNVKVLTDAQAKRADILAAMQDWLVDRASPGDVSVFYYAGHGSLVTNSRSAEPDLRDETIVPWDARAGAPDIRDKELARFFNAAAAKVRLTVILDSCHSGGASRGLAAAAVRRIAPDPSADSADPDRPPDPVDAGALFLAAAQDFQPAKEASEEGRDHGAFSSALLRVLRTQPVNASAEAVFLATRAVLQTVVADQEPVLRGTAARKRQPLFATTEDQGIKIALAVKGDELLVQAGFALGVGPGSILKPVRVGQPRLRITRIRDAATSEAEVVAGEAGTPQNGDVYEIERWAAIPEAALVVSVGDGRLSRGEVAAAARALAPLRRGPFRWIEDPSDETPDVVIQHTTAGWRVARPDGTGETLKGSLAVAAVTAAVRRVAPSLQGRQPSLFLRLPPPRELVAALALGAKGHDPVQAGSDADAQYLLVGRAGQRGEPAFAWVLAASEKVGSSALPRRSAWHVAEKRGEEVSSLLRADLQGLSRLRGWLRLEPPADDGVFPYELALRRVGDGAIVKGGEVRAGESYLPVLLRDDGRVTRRWWFRYVYLLHLDQGGEIRVLFPPRGEQLENRLPIFPAGQEMKEPPPEQPLGNEPVTFVAPRRPGAPETDTFVLVAADEAIPAVDQLEQDAITRGSSVGEFARGSPLTALLLSSGVTRGTTYATRGWNLQRLQTVTPVPQGR